MKHTSVFYSLPVKLLLALLCFLSILGTVFCTAHLVWMDMTGALDDEPVCRVVSRGWLPSDLFPSYPDYMIGEVQYMLHQKDFPETEKDGKLIYPKEERWNYFAALIDEFHLADSNAAVRITLFSSDGTPYVVFSNRDDISDDDITDKIEVRIEDDRYRIVYNDQSSETADTLVSDESISDHGTVIEEATTVVDPTPEPTKEASAEYAYYEFGLRKGLPVDDAYVPYRTAWENDVDHAVLSVLLPFLCGTAAVLFLILMLVGAGIRRERDGVSLMFYDKIPGELVLGVRIAAFVLIRLVLSDLLFDIMDIERTLGVLFGYTKPTSFYLLFLCAAVTLISVLVILILDFLCALVRRIRAKTILKNTLVYVILRYLGKGFRFLWHGISYASRRIGAFWKILLASGVYMFLTMILLLGQRSDGIIPWFFLSVLFFGAACFYLIGLDRVCKESAVIAAGKLDHKIEKKHLFGAPAQIAEDLNNISTAMQTAVLEQTKSERFRTELITNVSHDLKTPLTSIVNYTDLLSREEEKETPDREAEKEYITVLSKQSARLRRLTEDLIEASKASTGTLPVSLASVDAGELLSQALGEYASRFSAIPLTPVLSVPDSGAPIRADGKHLWRVFDNLLSNICKYSLPGTRVYLSAETDEKQVTLIFRNISASTLNVSAEELAERFVRGDASRHTEGSGLGLSIARSLTELQGGTLSLFVDGDLFKAVIVFPRADV